MLGLLPALGCDAEEPRGVGPEQRVIYGEDDRLEASQVDSSVLDSARTAVAMVTPWSRLDCNATRDDCDLIARTPEDVLGAPLCFGADFADQPVGHQCTGFLVGEDLLVTAAHCVEGRACEDLAFVFDYEINRNGTLHAESLQPLGCEEILYERRDAFEDIALVRLDAAADATPLCIEREEFPEVGTPLATIGHPLGLPKKTSDGGTATDAAFGDRFGNTVDAAVGSSGGPVFDRRTMRAYGAVVTAPEESWVYDGFNRCYFWNSCPEGGCGNAVNGASSTRSIEHLVPDAPCQEGRSPHQNPGNRFDVNDDRRIDQLDRTIVRDELAARGAGPAFFSLHDTMPRPPYVDVDGDGSLSHDDVVLIGARLGIPNVEPGSCGDFDGNGVVFNSSDYVALFQHYEGPPVPGGIDGDCNGDNRVGSADLVIAFQSGIQYLN